MDTFEEAAPAVRSAQMTEAVCWECGRRLFCHEYIVCCTGTLFHICPECEEKTNSQDDASENPAPAQEKVETD